MSKLTKEEYLEAVKELSRLRCLAKEEYDREEHAIITLEYLINEYFDLKEKYSKILDDCHDYRHETHAMKMTIRNLLEHFVVNSEEELKNIYLNKPYEFEELRSKMHQPIYDSQESKWYLLISVGKKGHVGSYGQHVYDKYFIQVRDSMGRYLEIEFKPNRFYPREVKKND